MAQTVDYASIQSQLEEHFKTLKELQGLRTLTEPQLKSVLIALRDDTSEGLQSLQGQISKKVLDAVIGKKGFLKRSIQAFGAIGDVSSDAFEKLIQNPTNFFYGLLANNQEDDTVLMKFYESKAQRAEFAKVITDSYRAQNEGLSGFWGRLKDAFFTALSAVSSGNFSSLLEIGSYVFSGDVNDVKDAGIRTTLIQNSGKRIALANRVDVESYYASDPKYASTLAKLGSGMRADRKTLDFVPLVFQKPFNSSPDAEVISTALTAILAKPDPGTLAKMKDGYANLWKTDQVRATVYTVAAGVTAWTVGEAGVGIYRSASQGVLRWTGMADTAAARGAAQTLAAEIAAARKAGNANLVRLLEHEAAASGQLASGEILGSARIAKAGFLRRGAGRLIKLGGVTTLVLGAYDLATTGEEVKQAEKELKLAVERGEIDAITAKTASRFNQLLYLRAAFVPDELVGTAAEVFGGVPEKFRVRSYKDLPDIAPPTSAHSHDIRYFTAAEVLRVVQNWQSTPADDQIKQYIIQKVVSDAKVAGQEPTEKMLKIIEGNLIRGGAGDNHKGSFVFAGRDYEIRRPDPHVGKSYGYASLRHQSTLYQRLVRDGFEADIPYLIRYNAPTWDDKASAAAFAMLPEPGVRLVKGQQPQKLPIITDVEWATTDQTNILNGLIDQFRDGLVKREQAVSWRVEQPMTALYGGLNDWVIKLIEASRQGKDAYAKEHLAFVRFYKELGFSEKAIEQFEALGIRMKQKYQSIVQGVNKDDSQAVDLASKQVRQALQQEFNGFIMDTKEGREIFQQFMTKRPPITYEEMLRLVTTPVFEAWAKKEYGAGADQAIKEIKEIALFQVLSNGMIKTGGAQEWTKPQFFPPSWIMQRDEFFKRIEKYAAVDQKFAIFMTTEEGLTAHYEWLEKTTITQLDKLALLRDNNRATHQAMFLAFIPQDEKGEQVFLAELKKLGITSEPQIAEIRTLREALSKMVPRPDPKHSMKVGDVLTYIWGGVESTPDYIKQAWEAYNNTDMPSKLPEGFDFTISKDKEAILDELIKMMKLVKIAPQFGKKQNAALDEQVTTQGGEFRKAAMVETGDKLTVATLNQVALAAVQHIRGANVVGVVRDKLPIDATQVSLAVLGDAITIKSGASLPVFGMIPPKTDNKVDLGLVSLLG